MAELMELKGISKEFGGVKALVDVDFELRSGEIHALVGKNGAGKSTLVQILSGVINPDKGKIFYRDQDVTCWNNRQKRLRISHVFQHIQYFPELPAGKNIFIGREEVDRYGRLKWDQMYGSLEDILSKFGIDKQILYRPMRELSVMEREIIAIVEALSKNSEIFIFDEPTAALGKDEAEQLLSVIQDLKAKGAAIVYISHRLEEIIGFADYVTVLRDGRKISTDSMASITKEQIVHKMVGEKIGHIYPHRTTQHRGSVLLKVSQLTKRSVFENITFEIHEGEILGLAGLLGAKRTDIAQAIFGTITYDSGTVEIERISLPKHSPALSIEKGLVYLPENRQEDGLILSTSIRENITLPILRQFGGNGFLNRIVERKIVQDSIDRLGIKAEDIDTLVNHLSGGNQQKVLFAKWLNTSLKVLMLDEPTQGIDVEAKAEIHRILGDLVNHGIGILLISSDLEELIAMSDRIIVVHEGRIISEFTGSEVTIEKILLAAMGVQQ
ncbi:MAG: sugar ABC transporter ATP-binding protein [Firmicutes bacterium]|nr:sugar ABC transporter ATP-binding protein [Bacillota bacterium]